MINLKILLAELAIIKHYKFSGLFGVYITAVEWKGVWWDDLDALMRSIICEINDNLQ